MRRSASSVALPGMCRDAHLAGPAGLFVLAVAPPDLPTMPAADMAMPVAFPPEDEEAGLGNEKISQVLPWLTGNVPRGGLLSDRSFSKGRRRLNVQSNVGELHFLVSGS